MLQHHFVRNKLIELENPEKKKNSFESMEFQYEISTCSIRNLSRPPVGQLKNVSF